jgi:hypothetical protein
MRSGSLVWSSRIVAIVFLILVAFVGRTEAQTWTLLAPSGSPPTGRGFHGVRSVYDPTSNRMVFFGGWEGGGGVYDGNRNDTWALTNANGLGGTPQWIQLLPQGNLPLPRSGNSTVYDPTNNRMIVFGGCDGGCFPTLNDVWVLTNANGLGGTPAWISLPTSGGGPAPRTDHTAVYDESSNTMIVFGGQDGGGNGCSTYSDIWVLSNANGLGGTSTWTQLTPAGGPPPGQYGPTAVYDPATNQMTVFGGGGIVNGICQDSNATWTLSNANGKGGAPVWTNLTPEGAPSSPMARAFHSAVYDSVTDRMTIFGGGGTALFNDVWVLSNANAFGGMPAWVQISPSGTLPVARNSQSAILDDVNNRMVIFGGSTDAGPLNDVWVLTNENGQVGTQLQITSVQPNHGGNAGSVTPSIIGSGFQAGAQLKLTGSGADIIASNVVVSDSGTLIQATFDLVGAATGARDLVITNLDGTSATLTSAFLIDQGGAPQISVQIIGPTNVRFDKSATYYLELSNIGSVDASAGLASLAVPSAVTFNQMSGDSMFAAGTTSNTEFATPSTSTTNSSFLLFATTAVPASASVFAPVQLTLPANAQVPGFVLTAGWQQDLSNLSLDDFLGLEGIPFIPYPTAGCLGCLNNYNSELMAYSNVESPYRALQAAHQTAVQAIATFTADITLATGGALVLASTGAGTLGTVSVGVLVAGATACVNNLIQSDTCLSSLRSTLQSALTAIQSCKPSVYQVASCLQALGLPPTSLLTSPAAKGLGEFQTFGGFAITAIDALIQGTDIIADESLAYGNFQAALAPYRLARQAYKTCFSPTTCSAPPLPPPPPNPPGTSLPVIGVASLDPNDKIGLPGAGPQRYVSGETPLAYSVYFANEDTATAPAQQVVITDQLDTVRDDLRTFRFGPITFGNRFIPPPPPGQNNLSTTLDLRPVNNILVVAKANLSPSTGLLTWNFQSLDPSTNQPPTDPLAGFLPPGVGGSTFFTIAPRQSLPTNTQIQNQATIVFDTNPAINTPTWINTLDSTPPATHVGPLPRTESSLSFPVQWTGTDVGAGIQDFTIYVSDNGGPYTAFQTDTPAMSATFTGQAGHAYAFYSIARDLVGNGEPAKTVAEATTQLGTDFSAFAAKLEITTGRRPSFEVRGSLALGSGTSAVALESQAVTLALGPYFVMIPAGSFRKGEERSYEFEGKINGVRLHFQIVHAGENNYKFRAEGTGVNLAGFSNPVTVQFLIGGNGGTTQVTAEIQTRDREGEHDKTREHDHD